MSVDFLAVISRPSNNVINPIARYLFRWYKAKVTLLNQLYEWLCSTPRSIDIFDFRKWCRNTISRFEAMKFEWAFFSTVDLFLPTQKIETSLLSQANCLDSDPWKMRFFDRLIKDSKVRPQAVIYSPSIQQIFGNDVASTLPEEILRLIFSYVCPHASYVGHRSWDDENGDDKDCMLCQTRDLARCIRVCKGWCTPAQNLL